MVAEDGESNWLEGAMLLMVYAILAMAFFFLPDAPSRPPGGYRRAAVNAGLGRYRYGETPAAGAVGRSVIAPSA